MEKSILNQVCVGEDELHVEEKNGTIVISGPLDLWHFDHAQQELKKYTQHTSGTFDLSGVTSLDTAGAFLLQSSREGAKFEHVKPEHKELLKLTGSTKIGSMPIKKRVSPGRQIIIRIGKSTVGFGKTAYDFIYFLGEACVSLLRVLRHPKRLRLVSITHHIGAIGVNAIPIISLIALVISVVIAYQGQAQLLRLGAEQYTANLIAISVLREMGVLLTAIMVAGRSGSAFAAEIGTMQVREEIDALRSIGFDPFELLVLPRLIALIIALPLLTVLADLMGLLGGGVISLVLTHISLPEYLDRVRQSAQWHDFFVGLIKAPIFAVAIAIVGARHGFRVKGSAESVGRETTASVVESIFLVLIIDGLFSIYFQQVGL